ncbi:MAG TPA: hypothetical protein VHE83_11185 [Mycobacteriales bacterium]|nr:hypothetical protein [Mycobacteriales bacterium]
MRIDCEGCRAKGPACGECVVSVMLGPPEDVELDGPTLVALANLADVGLVPRLRLIEGGHDRSAGRPDTGVAQVTG